MRKYVDNIENHHIRCFSYCLHSAPVLYPDLIQCLRLITSFACTTCITGCATCTTCYAICMTGSATCMTGCATPPTRPAQPNGQTMNCSVHHVLPSLRTNPSMRCFIPQKSQNERWRPVDLTSGNGHRQQPLLVVVKPMTDVISKFSFVFIVTVSVIVVLLNKIQNMILSIICRLLLWRPVFLRRNGKNYFIYTR